MEKSFGQKLFVRVRDFRFKLLLVPIIARWLSLDGAAVVSGSEQSGMRAKGSARAIVPCTRMTREGLLIILMKS
jgi:hypothetical protein